MGDYAFTMLSAVSTLSLSFVCLLNITSMIKQRGSGRVNTKIWLMLNAMFAILFAISIVVFVKTGLVRLVVSQGVNFLSTLTATVVAVIINLRELKSKRRKPKSLLGLEKRNV